MQAIETKYLSATTHRGERIKASSQAGSIVVAWDYDLDTTQNHLKAATALCEKLGWTGRTIPTRGLNSGVLPNGHHVHVFKQ